MAYKSLAGTHGAYNEIWVDNNYSGTEVEVASGWKFTAQRSDEVNIHH